MLNGFSICNNVSGLYRSTDDINNLRFKVKCKEVNKIIPLPNFEAFALQDKNAEKDFNEHFEEKNLSWQQKILGSREIYLYKDSANCKTDTEKKYHELIKEKDLKCAIHSPIIFTYVQDDKFKHDKRLTTDFENVKVTQSKLDKLYIRDDCDEEAVNILKNTSPQIEKQLDDLKIKDDHIVHMYIMIDMNNSESDPTFLLKREHVLFELLWNQRESTLSVSPDFNDLYISPYVLETNYYSKQVFHYSIEQDIQEYPDDAKLAEIQLLEKYDEAQRSMHNSKIFKNFSMPPKNILKCLFVIEIVSANISDYLSDLYVEYTVELPFGYMTPDSLKGVTQIAKPKSKDNKAHFGHVFELCFHYQLGISVDDSDLPQEPEIYFEVISCDWWGQHRTEGYCLMKLLVTQPGIHRTTLGCVRPQGPNERLWEMKRFFVGGKHTLDDLSWLSVPSVLEGKKLNKFGVKTVSSGTLDIAMNVIIQSKNFAKQNEANGIAETEPNHKETVAERLTADSLFKSVNIVLQAYKHAKDKLMSSQEGNTS